MTNASRKPYISRHGTLDGFTVWLVDGAYVRKNIDVQFTDVDTSPHRRYIPTNEVWVDSGTKGSEIDLMARSGVREAKAMRSGKIWAQAETAADKTERAERKHDQDAHARVKITKLGSNGKVSVWLVKGRAVRDRFDIDFTEGGHGRVYRWMPKNEIWLDDATTADDRPFNFLHELSEWNQMGKGKSYEAAHHAALDVELEARRDPSKFKGLLDREMKRAGGDLGIERIAEFRKLMKP
jgi:hypothetical protein